MLERLQTQGIQLAAASRYTENDDVMAWTRFLLLCEGDNDAKFVVAVGIGDYRYDKLRHYQWRQSWHQWCVVKPNYIKNMYFKIDLVY